MMKRIRMHATYANVASTVALTVALGTGGAYAANTVGSSDIIDESIRSVDVRNGQLNATDVAKASGAFFWNPAARGPDSCTVKNIDVGMDIRGDTIVVSPTFAAWVEVSWHVDPVDAPTVLMIHLCNHYPWTLDPARTRFTWLVFDS